METGAPVRFRIALHRLMGGYYARVIELPGCTSRGATEIEAVENARAAIGVHLWVARALADDPAEVELEIFASPSRPQLRLG